MTAEQLHQTIVQGDAPVIVDVRSKYEFRQGHIPDANHASLINIALSTRKIGPKDTVMVLVCEHGPRAILAHCFLRLKGFKKVDLLEGHMANWRRSGRPMVSNNLDC